MEDSLVFKNELKNNDAFLSVSEEVKKVCAPLLKHGITYFTYLKNFKDGSQINLSNSSLWLEHYYQLKLYRSSLFEHDPNTYKSGFLLWPNNSDLEVLRHARTYFDSDNGITVIEQNDDFSEFYFFSGSTQDPWLSNFYVNNLDFLKKFIKIFKAKLANAINNAEKNKIIIPGRYRNLNAKSKKTLMPILNTGEIEIIKSLDHLYPKDEQSIHKEDTPHYNIISCLTKREVNIAVCLLEGRTAKETAKILFISPRTVEQYLENMKEKFSCKNKFQLANILSNINADNEIFSKI